MLKNLWSKYEVVLNTFWKRIFEKNTKKCCQHFGETFVKVMGKFWRKFKEIFLKIWGDFKGVTQIFWRKYEEFWKHFGESSFEKTIKKILRIFRKFWG